MGDLTPSETLLAAATLIRDTASKAAAGHPAPWHIEPGSNDWWYVGTPAPHLVTSATREPVAAWIALMSPDKAEPLAAWLELEAEIWPVSPAHTSTERIARRRRAALTLARSILLTQDATTGDPS